MFPPTKHTPVAAAPTMLTPVLRPASVGTTLLHCNTFKLNASKLTEKQKRIKRLMR